MNIFITGATGFIGGTLARRLAEGGEDLTLLTRHKEGVEPFLKEKAQILEGDFCIRASLESLPPLQKSPHVLIHLAASLDYFGNKRYLNAVNVEGTVNLFNWAAEKEIKKFVFVSSIEAMGMVDCGCAPADEDGICLPVSSYGQSKLEAEKRLKFLAAERKVKLLILRLGNVYGPGSPNFIMPIANAILSGGSLMKFLSAYQDRYLHLVYISDVIEGIMQCIQRSNVEGTYILAGREYVTVKGLFVLVSQELGIERELPAGRNIAVEGYLKLRQKFCKILNRADLVAYFCTGKGKNIHRTYSTEKAKRDLGFSPQVSLREGIVKTLDWAKKEGLLIQ